MRRPKTRISNGIRNTHRNSSTSQGELRKSCVTTPAAIRTALKRDSWAMPTGTPATVPMAIAMIEIRMLKPKPHSSSGAQRISTSSAVALAACGCCATATVAPSPTMSAKITSTHRTFPSPSRGEDDAPRVSAAFLLQAKPREAGKALTRSARLGGGVCSIRGWSPPPGTPSDLARLSEAASSGALGELSPWRSVLPLFVSKAVPSTQGEGKRAQRALPAA